MPNLKHSEIYRGGVTASHLSFETDQCSASVNQRDNTVDIEFLLASKGGGTTNVLLQIGKEDLRIILEEIANKIPESVGVLSDCAALANRKNLELLEEARRVHDDDKARTKILIDDLEAVEEFVSEKYYEAPAGKDEKEEKLRHQIQKVINSLCQLS